MARVALLALLLATTAVTATANDAKYPCCNGNVCGSDGTVVTMNGKTLCCPAGSNINYTPTSCTCESSSSYTCPASTLAGPSDDQEFTNQPTVLEEPETRMSLGTQNVTFVRGRMVQFAGKTDNGGTMEWIVEERPFSWCSVIRVSGIPSGDEICWSKYYASKWWLTVQSTRKDFWCTVACFALEFD